MAVYGEGFWVKTLNNAANFSPYLSRANALEIKEFIFSHN